MLTSIISYPRRIVMTYLDLTSMYMVAVHALGLLWLCVVVTSISGVLPYFVTDILGATVVMVIASMVTSVLCGVVTKVPAHHVSSFITGLIVFFIITPEASVTGLVTIAAATILAVTSKYVLVYRKQHLANPAAVGVIVIALLGIGSASWWVATPVLFLPLIFAGALVVSKIRKWDMVLAFMGAGFIVFAFEEWRFGSDFTQTWSQYFLSYPMLFLAAFMLTEPFSTPPTKRLQIWYAVLVAFLANTALFTGFIYMTPELALVIGNLAFYAFTLRQKLFLTLMSKREIAPRIFEFTFKRPVGMQYRAGQYLEWMLPHSKNDSRGIRRYFTITSAPSEDVLRLSLKIPTPGSSFKQALESLPVGGAVVASQLAGDFLLLKNPATKLGWVAGGIGVTPFVSQASYLRSEGEKRDIVLVYGAATQNDFAFINELQTVAQIVSVVGSGDVPAGAESGFVSVDIIARRVPDYIERTWYISGPPGMVNASVSVLQKLGVSRKRIIKDFFPGLA